MTNKVDVNLKASNSEDNEVEDNKDSTSLETVASVDLISEEKVNSILANSPMPRVTKEYMKSRIVNINFNRLSGTVTHCQITLDNGYSTSGEAACVNLENFDKEVGERLSYDSAFTKLWPLFGFLLAEKQYLKSKA